MHRASNSDTQQRCEEIFFDPLYDSTFISPFISLNLTMPVFCIGSSEGRTESDDKGLVCYYSIKAYRVFLGFGAPDLKCFDLFAIEYQILDFSQT